MYLSTVERPRKLGWKGLSGNVFALGTVSLITDVSSEMVTAVLPLYLVVGLGLSPAAYGVIDGVYTGATTLLRLVGGYLADKTDRRKAVAGTGYALSAVAKLGLLIAGTSTALLGAAITIDRAGKGLRTAPRDALITLSTPSGDLGRAFGVHRAMDGVGAFLGPLVALAVLAAAADSFDAVFVASFCVAAMGVVVLAMFVRDHRSTLPAREPVRVKEIGTLLRDSRVRRLVIAAAVLGLATIGDGFVYLLLQKREGLTIGWFPLLAVGTSLVYLLLAAPLGALADKIGRLPVMLAGYVALATAYLLIHSPLDGIPLHLAVLALYGTFYATTDGVLMALAGPALPERLRTTGIALIQSGQALAYLGSSVLFGLAWKYFGPETATRLAAAGVATALVTTAYLLGRRR
ncbi:MFS transporter [Saccharothrix violaceirubra]|uniref:MFS family permease n=1 Tax=Saccharothrix violaceirubra TaxID=413306 RepID=A0A7W7T6R1_9PSEU|nr:MFS transporter [Saccharothrix violaceirubra]MBB4967062.1 MFS family permease [Saccharothrix violaceirubra]